VELEDYTNPCLRHLVAAAIINQT